MCSFAAHANQTAQIAILDEPRQYATSEPWRDLGRPFDASSVCSENRSKTAATIAEALGPNVRAIAVHSYLKPGWPDLSVVADYVHRILAGLPEAGHLARSVIWSEVVFPEIVGSVEFANGPSSRIEFGNGYAHVEDESGCQWWARYLGGDRSKWIVRK